MKPAFINTKPLKPSPEQVCQTEQASTGASLSKNIHKASTGANLFPGALRRLWRDRRHGASLSNNIHKASTNSPKSWSTGASLSKNIYKASTGASLSTRTSLHRSKSLKGYIQSLHRINLLINRRISELSPTFWASVARNFKINN